MQFTAKVVLKYSATKTKSTKPNRRSDIRQSSLCLSFLKLQSTLSFLCSNDSVCLKILEINSLSYFQESWSQRISWSRRLKPDIFNRELRDLFLSRSAVFDFYFVLFCRGRSVFVFVILQCCLAGRGLTRRRKRSEKWNSWKPKYLAIKECTQYIRVLVSTSRSDFHNTDIPDLSERGTRSSLVFSCHQSSCGHVMSTSLESRAVRVTVSPLPVFHGTHDRSSKMTDSVSVVYNERELQEKGSEETARSCAYLSTSVWVTYLLPLALGRKQIIE